VTTDQLQNRPVALVTGATRGIGRAIAADLGRTHHVLVGGRSTDAVDALVQELPSAAPFVGDLGAGEVPALPDRLDVLVHSAGVEQGTTVADTPRAVWEQVFATNVFAVAELTRLALPALRAAMQRQLVAKLGESYDTDYYLAPEDVAAAVRTVVDLPERGTVESLAIRPTRRR